MEKRKLIIEVVDGKEYEIAGNDGIRPAANSVGTAEIEDEGVKKEDLDKEIQEKLDVIDDSNVVSEDELSDEWEQAMQNAMNGNGTQEAGASEGEASGDGPSLDDL